jgi:hypothetical protein
MWTTGTEKWRPGDRHRGTRRIFLGLERLEAITKPVSESSIQHRHHEIRVERAESRHEYGAQLIGLPDDPRTSRETVERILHERLDARTLLFDHEYFG